MDHWITQPTQDLDGLVAQMIEELTQMSNLASNDLIEAILAWHATTSIQPESLTHVIQAIEWGFRGDDPEVIKAQIWERFLARIETIFDWNTRLHKDDLEGIYAGEEFDHPLVTTQPVDDSPPLSSQLKQIEEWKLQFEGEEEIDNECDAELDGYDKWPRQSPFVIHLLEMRQNQAGLLTNDQARILDTLLANQKLGKQKSLTLPLVMEAALNTTFPRTHESFFAYTDDRKSNRYQATKQALFPEVCRLLGLDLEPYIESGGFTDATGSVLGQAWDFQALNQATLFYNTKTVLYWLRNQVLSASVSDLPNLRRAAQLLDLDIDHLLEPKAKTHLDALISQPVLDDLLGIQDQGIWLATDNQTGYQFTDALAESRVRSLVAQHIDRLPDTELSIIANITVDDDPTLLSLLQLSNRDKRDALFYALHERVSTRALLEMAEGLFGLNSLKDFIQPLNRSEIKALVNAKIHAEVLPPLPHPFHTVGPKQPLAYQKLDQVPSGHLIRLQLSVKRHGLQAITTTRRERIDTGMEDFIATESVLVIFDPLTVRWLMHQHRATLQKCGWPTDNPGLLIHKVLSTPVSYIEQRELAAFLGQLYPKPSRSSRFTSPASSTHKPAHNV